MNINFWIVFYVLAAVILIASFGVPWWAAFGLCLLANVEVKIHWS